MFNFGWGELVVIGIVALIAIGPKELPTVLRTIGQWTGKVRRMASEFQGQFQDALREAELHDLQKHAEDLTSDVKSFANVDPLADVQKDIESATADLDNIPSGNAPEPVATPAEPATAMAASNPLPNIDAPPAELAPPPGEKDFASTEPQPAKTKPAKAKRTAKAKPAEVEKQSGDGA
jgi:sec-independent protein translocase protein TatB